jgi:3-hydroxyacyl-CoA dehydrogenase/enoyl-CoA hydratase/3-hydroxybutyryl-CoA epimerase
LEIVRTKKTADWVIAAAVKFGKKQGKTVIVVNDGPGFYTSRILAPYVNEAGHMIAEGVPIDSIDKALKKFGFPVGPITLLDEVGIDVGTKIAPILAEAFGERMNPPEEFAKLADDNRLGRKNRKGFYSYDSSGKSTHQVDETIYDVLGVNSKFDLDADIIAERCVLQMLNEAAYCLQQKIINSAMDADIGAIFGLGFPPFLGGPFRYMDEQGIGHIVERLEYHQKQSGERFKPAPILMKMGAKGKTFY